MLHVVELPEGVYEELLYDKQSCIELGKEKLTEIGKKLNIASEDQYVECGNPKKFIPEYMKKLGIDLLVVGHHERHGIYHLLGSTAYAADLAWKGRSINGKKFQFSPSAYVVKHSAENFYMLFI